MPVTKSTFGEYELYTIKNSSGAYVRIASLGAAVQSIVVPNRNGAPTDVVLGYDTPGEYLRNDGYFGAFVGRYANRIANAAFMLNGREYKISANEGKNTLHGGSGLSKRRFTEIAVGENALTLGISDPDGGDGFPGKVEARVTYEFSEDNELSISYEAVSDADTYLNLTWSSKLYLVNHKSISLYQDGPIIPWKYALFICSITFARSLFFATSATFSAEIVKFGLYNLFKTCSCKFATIYPVVFLIIKSFDSKYVIASFISFKGNANFFDKSFNFISFLYCGLRHCG